MRISVGTDHAGLPLKQAVAEWLHEAGHEVVDFGVHTPDRVDYPDYVAPAARAVAAGECQLGIVFGGSGTGEQIVANKIRGIRCVQATDPVTARLAREHNDANMMAMGARIVGVQLAIGCVEAFLAGRYEAGRHAARVEKITALEREGA
ncbi:ribose 5-phosphate isomerase B [soil metagenome]